MARCPRLLRRAPSAGYHPSADLDAGADAGAAGGLAGGEGRGEGRGDHPKGSEPSATTPLGTTPPAERPLVITPPAELATTVYAGVKQVRVRVS